jgi:phage shock protein PspC (stress-responsive transcriptional regulator)
MTSTPPEAPPDGPGPSSDDRGHAGPRVTRDELRELGRLRRTSRDRRVAGVAGGLARHLDIDPVILRVAFVVLAFFGGAGLVLYAACWLLLPSDDRDRAPLSLDERTRGLALVLAGAFAILLLLGDTWGGRQWLDWPLVLVGVVALVLLGRHQSPAPRPGPTPPPAPALPPEADPADPSYQPRPAYPAYQPDPTHQPTAAYPTDPTYQPDAVYPTAAAAPVYPAYQPVPRAQRRRGPILFWFTLALVALVEGLLGVADLAGVPVADAAYPALAVATVGGMLLVGAFYGRAGGLVLLGLVASLVLGVTTAADNWEGDTVRHAPVRAVDVRDSYRISAGELVLDLRTVRNPAALDGRTVRLRGDIGRLEVRVPSGLDVDVSARVSGPGDILLFGEDHGGIDLAATEQHDGGRAAPTLTIDAGLGVGQIEVHE